MEVFLGFILCIIVVLLYSICLTISDMDETLDDLADEIRGRDL